MKTPALTTSALTLHNLGLAAGFGGALFAKASLDPAVRAISDQRQRTRVIDAAWETQKFIHWGALAATTLTWLAGRSAISGRLLGRSGRRLVLTKDVLLGTTAAASVASAFLGSFVGKGSPPIEEGNVPAANTPPDKAAAQRALKVTSFVNLAAMAGVIGVTAWLNQKAMSSARWGALSRVLP